MNKSILILAGGGFLGRALINSFKKNGFVRIGCLDLIDPYIEGVVYHNLNLLEPVDEELDKIVNTYDLVVNCLGQVTNPINICFRLNSEGIKRVVDAVKRNNKFFFHFSTVTVYGSTESANEETLLNPETAYSCAKAFAEYLIESNLPDANYCIVRLSNLYGEQQPKGVFSYIKRSFYSDKKLEFNNDGYMTRYYLHVNDCAVIVSQLLMKQLSGKYNLIGPDKFTLRELIRVAENQLESKFDTSFNNISSWDNTLSISDSKIKQKIEFEYNHSIEDNFKKMLN